MTSEQNLIMALSQKVARIEKKMGLLLKLHDAQSEQLENVCEAFVTLLRDCKTEFGHGGPRIIRDRIEEIQ